MSKASKKAAFAAAVSRRAPTLFTQRERDKMAKSERKAEAKKKAKG